MTGQHISFASIRHRAYRKAVFRAIDAYNAGEISHDELDRKKAALKSVYDLRGVLLALADELGEPLNTFVAKHYGSEGTRALREAMGEAA